MSMTREEIENAAFWGLDVCIDCESIVQAEGYFCPNCGCSPVLPAEKVVKILDLVKEEDDG